jgi:TonB family protein
MWRRSSVATGMFASLVLHGVSLVGLHSEAEPRRAGARTPELPAELAFEPLYATNSSAETTWLRSKVELGGPSSDSALDLDAKPGRGGSAASEGPTLLLFSFVSPLTLQDTDLNNVRENQVQRIATSPLRATQEERRATPHAADAVFLASGTSGHQERRTPALRDAQRGAETNTSHPRAAPRPEPEPAHGGGERRAQASERAQAESERTPRGIARGAGRSAQLAAKVQYARPNVDQGPAATPAEANDAKVRDNHDAELLAALLQRSIVDASAQRARQRAAGSGGAEQGVGLSHDSDGRGARARPYLPGPGNASALDTADKRYVRWFVEQKQRVQNELIFPLPRALAKDQGISIYRVVVRRDGGLATAPHLVRSSGFSDFDEAAIVAIRRALPFSPLPEQLLPGEADLSLLIPVAFSNPMVQ